MNSFRGTREALVEMAKTQRASRSLKFLRWVLRTVTLSFPSAFHGAVHITSLIAKLRVEKVPYAHSTRGRTMELHGKEHGLGRGEEQRPKIRSAMVARQAGVRSAAHSNFFP